MTNISMYLLFQTTPVYLQILISDPSTETKLPTSGILDRSAKIFEIIIRGSTNSAILLKDVAIKTCFQG